MTGHDGSIITNITYIVNPKTGLVTSNETKTVIDAKIDDEGINELKKIAKENNLKVFFISSVANEGIKELMDYILAKLSWRLKVEMVVVL